MWDLSKMEEIVNAFNIRGQVNWNRLTSPGVQSNYILNNMNVFKNETWLCDSAGLGQIKGFSGHKNT